MIKKKNSDFPSSRIPGEHFSRDHDPSGGVLAQLGDQELAGTVCREQTNAYGELRERETRVVKPDENGLTRLESDQFVFSLIRTFLEALESLIVSLMT